MISCLEDDVTTLSPGRNASWRAGRLVLFHLLWHASVKTEFGNAFMFIWGGNFDSNLVSQM